MKRQDEPRRWAEIDRLFERTLARSPGEREVFVREVCGSDHELREAIEDLLSIHDEAASFLSRPPTIEEESLRELASTLGRHGPNEAGVPSARPGERVGDWRIVEELGRGGMATVYRAERVGGEFEQDGALKLLRRGLDTEDLVHRFRTERQILSSLDHPNIAGLLDGGATDDGRPYLVMECVDGVRITEWCDERGRTVEERLRLFLAVARAVHHAHGKLVVHRDLKPSNILVTSDGHVMLLDFGIAKLLDPDVLPGSAVRTRSGHRALTPDYASPEQLRGDPVTTATDVYQLGLLLHRLLSGARPRDVRGTVDGDAESGGSGTTTLPTAPSRIVAEAAARVAAARGSSPRRLEQRLRGDLDTIVLTALRPDVDERYGSALEMARDIENHLDGLPITARPQTLAYRTRKFLARHRWLAPVAAAIIAGVGLYVGTLVRHGNQLEAERNAARQQAERAERVRDVLVGVFQSSDPWDGEGVRASGNATTLQTLEAGTRRARSDLAGEPELQIDVLTAIGDVYVGLGHPDRAHALLEESLQLRRATHGARSSSSAIGLLKLGRAIAAEEWYDTAAVVLREGVELIREIPSTMDTLVVAGLIDLAYAEKGQGRFDDAERHLVEALRIAESSDDVPRDYVARAHHHLALLYPPLERYEDARAAAETALKIRREQYGDEHPETAWELVGYAGMIWRTSHDPEDFVQAITMQREAIDILERTLGPDHSRLLMARTFLASMVRGAGRLDEAVALMRETHGAHVEFFGSEDQRTTQASFILASILYNRGDLGEAAGHARRTAETLVRLAPGHPRRGRALSLLCAIEIHRGNTAEAETACRQAGTVFEAAGMVSAPVAALAECRLGHLLSESGRRADAIRTFERTVPILWQSRTILLPGHVHECLQFAAATYEAAERTDEAERLRTLAERTSRRGLPGVAR